MADEAARFRKQARKSRAGYQGDKLASLDPQGLIGNGLF
jgi:hypothetical protein